MDLVGDFQIFPLGQIYIVNLYYINILKLGTYELVYSVVQKISTKLVIVVALLCVI